MNFKGENCFYGNTYNIADDCIIIEVFICTSGREEYQYYVKHPENDSMILFSFGVPINTSLPHEIQGFSRGDLLNLYRNGYFNSQIAMLEEEL